MKSRALFIRAYERSFKAPVRIKEQVLTVRRGFWIEVEDEQGQTFCAECAPLPGWHSESLAEVEELLRVHSKSFLSLWDKREAWSWQKPYFGLWPSAMDLPPSLQTSLEILLFLSLRQDQVAVPKSKSSMTLAGLLRAETGGLEARFEELWSRGFRTFKLKVGEKLSREDEALIEILKKKSSEGLKLRLDANQLPSAYALQLLKSLPIDFWEEPTAHEQEVLQSVGIPIACDEALGGLDPDLDPWPSAEFLVLKPNHLGFQRFLRWMQLAPDRKKEVVLSNTYESEPSLQLYAQVYGSIVSNPHALGFGTLASFTEPWPEINLFSRGSAGDWPQRLSAPRSWPEYVSERRLLWRS